MEKKTKRPYSKPHLRTIGLETKDVLAVGCKNISAPMGIDLGSCGIIAATPCSADGS